MKKYLKNKYVISGIIISILILLDQLTKILANKYLTLGSTKVIIPYILEFQLVKNNGASFGMLEGKLWLFIIITIIALSAFIYLLKDGNYKNKKVYTISINLLIGGTLGNFIDRLFRSNHVVIDFLVLPFLTRTNISFLQFIFNLADLFLTFGIVLLAIDIIFLERKRKYGNQN